MAGDLGLVLSGLTLIVVAVFAIKLAMPIMKAHGLTVTEETSNDSNDMTPVCSSIAEVAPSTQGGWWSARAQIVLGACACGGATAFLFGVDPSRHAVYPQCMLYNATGIYCAGCGATRALYALLHGRMLVALHDNALFVAALPLLLYVIGSYALQAWRANAWPEIFLDSRKVPPARRGDFLVMVTFMLLRNLPGAPFAWLKPL